MTFFTKVGLTVLTHLKHEILHALGFSVSLYPFYRDSGGTVFNGALKNVNSPMNANFLFNGTPTLRVSNSVLRKVNRKNWKVRNGKIDHKVFVISTSTVLVSIGCLQ